MKRKCNNPSVTISTGVAESVVTQPVFRLGRNGCTAEVSAASNLPNILIVDDEHDILQLYKQYLSGHPLNIEVFADPVQLLGRLAQVDPSYYDLAIIDVKMPKINGFQLYQILTALKPNIKTLFVSALDYAGDVLSGLRGIDKEEDFIKKPVSRETFLCAVNRKIRLYA
jgi:DNA-binding response OmpR family regulator